jgi:hypothetical protein
MDVGEGGVAGIYARRQQRRHLLNLGTLADEHHALARRCPAVRKVEEDGCLAAAHRSKAVRTVVECAGKKNRKRCSSQACAARPARCRMAFTAWESACTSGVNTSRALQHQPAPAYRARYKAMQQVRWKGGKVPQVRLQTHVLPSRQEVAQVQDHAASIAWAAWV